MRKGTFKLKRSSLGSWYFLLYAPNGQPIMSSSEFVRKANALAQIEFVRKIAPEAEFEDYGTKKKDSTHDQ